MPHVLAAAQFYYVVFTLVRRHAWTCRVGRVDALLSVQLGSVLLFLRAQGGEDIVLVHAGVVSGFRAAAAHKIVIEETVAHRDLTVGRDPLHIKPGSACPDVALEVTGVGISEFDLVLREQRRRRIVDVVAVTRHRLGRLVFGEVEIRKLRVLRRAGQNKGEKGEQYTKRNKPYHF